MAFYGETFVFDGVPSEHYGLMLYSFESANTEESELGTNVEIIEERLNRRSDPIHYGTTENKALEFSMTFGSLRYLDKYDTEQISSWLTGHNEYKWLEICQEDLAYVRYKCLINDLKSVHINGMPVAFTCTVILDSQYAYGYPSSYRYQVPAEPLNLSFVNKSSSNRFYYPTLIIHPAPGAADFSIVNHTDGNRAFRLTDLPDLPNLEIRVDNKNQIISGKDTDHNFYKGFNFQFFRLKKGRNELTAAGPCRLTIQCEFLRKVGV